MKKSRLFSLILAVVMIFTLATLVALPAYADEAAPVATAEAEATEEAAGDDGSVTSAKGWAAAITIAVVGAAGAIGMAWAIAKSADSMARQPEAAGKINGAMMLGLVFIETAIIYALIVAILVIFVL